MRRIIEALREYRVVQLEHMGAQPARLQEARDLFTFMDRALSGATLAQNGGWEGPESGLAEAMTSADFTYALQEFVQRQLLPAYQSKRFNFEPFVKTDVVPNFLPVTRYQNRSDLDDLEYVGEKGEPRPGNYDDATKRQYQVYQWQKQFDFSMQALANDDLGYFSDCATRMGQSARRTLERFVSRLYTNATTIGRLVGLGALYSTTGRLTTTRIADARMAFNQRTNAAGNPIAATLRFIVHHAGLVDTVRVIRASQLIPELATTAANVVAGDFTPIEDPYIAGAAPNLPWYAFANYAENNIVPFVLARRSAVPAPLLIRKRSDMESFISFQGAGTPLPPQMGDFATGNVVVKVYDEWGTYIDGTEGNLFDFRGAYYSAGTAP